MSEQDLDEVARQFCDFLEQCAEDALEPINGKVLTPEDRQQIEYALRILRPSFEGCVARLNEPLQQSQQHQMQFAGSPDALSRLMGAAFLIGSRCGVSDSAKRFFNQNHGSPGGEGSAKTRRLNARKWQAALQEIAEGILNESPRLPMTEVARRALKKKGGLPDYRTCYDHLRDWYKARAAK